MTPIEEIKKDTKEIEDNLREQLMKFIEKNGHCSIRISIDTNCYISGTGRKKLMSLGVEMNVTV